MAKSSSLQYRTYPALQQVTQSFGERTRRYLREAGFNNNDAAEVEAALTSVVGKILGPWANSLPPLLMQKKLDFALQPRAESVCCTAVCWLGASCGSLTQPPESWILCDSRSSWVAGAGAGSSWVLVGKTAALEVKLFSAVAALNEKR